MPKIDTFSAIVYFFLSILVVPLLFQLLIINKLNYLKSRKVFAIPENINISGKNINIFNLTISTKKKINTHDFPKKKLCTITLWTTFELLYFNFLIVILLQKN